MKYPIMSFSIVLVLASLPALACGPFFKATLLSSGMEGKIVLASPVADVLAEMLAAPGAPVLEVDKEVKYSGKKADLPAGLTISEEGFSGAAWDVLRRDLSDLSEALGNNEGRMAVLVGYAQARRVGLSKLPEKLEAGPAAGAPAVGIVWPKGVPAEFKLYAEGAVHFHEGRLAEAQLAWEKVLALPAEQRRFRSTWAAWMMGRTKFRTDPAAAVTWFQRIRSEAKSGADSLNRASASFGWEALAEKALLAADPGGFSTARAERIIWLLASHAKAGGGEPYFLSGRHYATNQELPVREATGLAHGWMMNAARAKAAAASPYLRQVMTASLLPITRSAPVAGREKPQDTTAFAALWFEALEAVDAKGTEDLADRLAWAAYEAGNYQQAAAWLKRARESPMAHWLMAKQALQAGRITEAAQHLEAARPGFGISQPQSNIHEDYEGYPAEASALQREQFEADLGLVRLAMNDFPGSLDALSRSGFWEDAAYVLENVVTLPEAVKYAEKWPLEPAFKGKAADLPSPLTVASLTTWIGEQEKHAAGPVPQDPDVETYAGVAKLHHAVARRLAREDDTKGSREFQKAWLRPVLDLFLKQRAIGQNKELPKAQRAAGFWKAALIHRYFGMDLWGYEGFPDSFITQGAFEAERVREFRLGILPPQEGEDPAAKSPVIFPPVSAAEQERLKANVPHPGKRFNYRYQAYALARQAFDLMPDNSGELSIMINLTGWWFVKHDEEAARRSVAVLLQRCPVTSIGRQAKSTGWVVTVSPEQEEALKRLQ